MPCAGAGGYPNDIIGLRQRTVLHRNYSEEGDEMLILVMLFTVLILIQCSLHISS